jgi:hypothetical protein
MFDGDGSSIASTAKAGAAMNSPIVSAVIGADALAANQTASPPAATPAPRMPACDHPAVRPRSSFGTT